MFPSENVFDIIDFYMNIINKLTVKAFDIGTSKWFDLGKIETLQLLIDSAH